MRTTRTTYGRCASRHVSGRGRGGPLVDAAEPRVLFATFVVTTAADDGAGSLRQAIVSSNANDTPAPVDDLIKFTIAPGGAQTINLLSALPAITGNVTLDGTTQTGYDDNGPPLIRINGQGAGAGADGLRVASRGPVAASNVLGLIVSGFSGNGMVISGELNSVSLCYVGTDATGAAAGPGNGGHGVLITGNNNLVKDCIVAFNGLDGAAVGATSVGNTLAPNSYFSNGGMAIDLGDDGPTPNDPGDADGGANRRQNFPVLTVSAATAPATGVNVSGTINTTPNTFVEVILYSSPTNDGEGRTALDVVRTFTTNAAGNGSFSVNLPGASTSAWFTATATSFVFGPDSTDTNTSEFSPPVSAAAQAPSIAAVYVRGSAWSAPFRQYLESKGLGDDVYGYRVDNLPAAATLPWINLDEIVLRYSGTVTGGIPDGGVVGLHGDRAGGDYAVTSVTQVDPQTYALHIDRALGELSAGDNNGVRVTMTVPGSAPGGGTYSLRMNVLQGDVDGSGGVLANDFSAVKKKFFKSTTDPVTGTDIDYSPLHDVDGSGSILANDFSEVKKRFFDALPPAAAAQSGDDLQPGVARDLFSTTPVLG